MGPSGNKYPWASLAPPSINVIYSFSCKKSFKVLPLAAVKDILIYLTLLPSFHNQALPGFGTVEVCRNWFKGKALPTVPSSEKNCTK